MKKLKCLDLTIGYDKKPLIDKISLAIDEGKIVALIGPNGCGKTTLLKSLSALLKPIKGSVFLAEEDIFSMPDLKRAKEMSVMLTDKRGYEYTSCFDVISVGRYPYTSVIGRLSEKDNKIINEVMEEVGITELRDRAFDKLSDGQRQRVLLARALVQEPSLLVLDEPTSFLDIGYKMEFMQVIKRLAGEKKISILMSLHELDLAAAIADQIVSITREHEMDKVGTPGEILTDEYISKLFNLQQGKYSLSKGYSFNNNTDNDNEANINENNKYNKNEDKRNENKYCPKNSTVKNVSSDTHFIMVQGTMSNAGKSLIAAGLCRIFKQDGYKVAPFKSQNMALNSFITEDGLEMGRAQVMQAEACGIKPDVHMNPILLKPTDDVGSQVIVNGEVRGNMRAREYFEYKKSLIPDIEKSIEYLSSENDIIVIEGAGSPAEINLKQNDIVNMGMARLVDAPVILVGDIDRGGVFAQLIGTLELLEDDEKARVKGLIVNKFRGDKTILDPGIDMLRERGNVPVVGVIPYMDVQLEDEDSLTERFEKRAKGIIDIAVIRLPHISNFTDFDVFEQLKEVSVRYVRNSSELDTADLVIIPGSKNTISDMYWLRENGFEVILNKLAKKNCPIFGICGGYQMLGQTIEDSKEVEAGGSVRGIGLLDCHTHMQDEKYRKQVEGKITKLEGPLQDISDKSFYGYEIHMGKTTGSDEAVVSKGSVYGTYVHGIFDSEEVARAVIDSLAKNKNIKIETDRLLDYREFKEEQYDKLASIMREYMDMKEIYKMMGIEKDIE